MGYDESKFQSVEYQVFYLYLTAASLDLTFDSSLVAPLLGIFKWDFKY